MINIEHIKKCEIFSQDETDAQVLIIHLYSSKQHTDALCRKKKVTAVRAPVNLQLKTGGLCNISLPSQIGPKQKKTANEKGKCEFKYRELLISFLLSWSLNAC